MKKSSLEIARDICEAHGLRGPNGELHIMIVNDIKNALDAQSAEVGESTPAGWTGYSHGYEAGKKAQMNAVDWPSEEILNYCAPHWEQMWAATIAGMVYKIDFRDAAMRLKERMGKK